VPDEWEGVEGVDEGFGGEVEKGSGWGGGEGVDVEGREGKGSEKLDSTYCTGMFLCEIVYKLCPYLSKCTHLSVSNANRFSQIHDGILYSVRRTVLNVFVMSGKLFNKEDLLSVEAMHVATNVTPLPLPSHPQPLPSNSPSPSSSFLLNLATSHPPIDCR
jgi:hypothetical protein